MKTKKSIIITASALIGACSILGACGGGGNSGGGNNRDGNSLVGDWVSQEYDGAFVYTFKDNGSGNYDAAVWRCRLHTLLMVINYPFYTKVILIHSKLLTRFQVILLLLKTALMLMWFITKNNFLHKKTGIRLQTIYRSFLMLIVSKSSYQISARL